METRKRRSRMRRISSGKRVELTERDVELFKLLSRYRYLRSDFLYAFLGGRSEKRFKERLGALYHDGRYISRPEQQWDLANSRYLPAVYELDDRGWQVLRNEGRRCDESPLLVGAQGGAHRQFAHQLMICECLASIEVATLHNLGLRFVPWQQIIAKAPEMTRAFANPFEIPTSITYIHPRSGKTQHSDAPIIPDGLFGLEYQQQNQNSYRFFALEVDRATMPVKRTDFSQSSYFRKLLGYQHILSHNTYKSHFGVPNLFVLTVSTNATHTASIMREAEALMAERRSKFFLFKSVSDATKRGRVATPPEHLLKEPWQRVGYDPLQIDKA